MRGRGYILLGVILFALLFVLLIAGPTFATPSNGPCTVEADGSGSHATIQAAVDDGACDLVHVGSGTFHEHVWVNRRLTIEGQGARNTIVDGGEGVGPCCSVFVIGYDGAVTLTDLAIANGHGEHGGIVNEGVLTLLHCSLRDNEAVYGGGGIHNGRRLTIIGCALVGNRASDGGAISNYGTMTVTNSTLSNNSAGPANPNGGGRGGGIFNAADTYVANSTLVGNSADDQGGGIYNSPEASFKMANTILADNAAVTDPDCSGILASLDYNLLENTSGCSINGDVGHNISGLDPQLGALAYNGGSTRTHALLLGSPALDSGYCPVVTSDQRGFPRPFDMDGVDNVTDGCDIGAYESWVTPRVYLPTLLRPHGESGDCSPATPTERLERMPSLDY